MYKIFQPVFLLFLLVFFACVHPARAEISEQDKGRIKNLLEKILEKQTAAINDYKDIKLLKDGEIELTDNDDFVTALLPKLKVVYPNNHILDIGQIIVNIKPHTQDGQWIMRTAFPSIITLYDDDKTQQVTFSLGSQDTTGVWDESLDNYAVLDGKYSDLHIKSTDPVLDLKIPSATARTNLQKDARNLWSGPASFQIEGLKGHSDQDVTFSIGKIDVDMTIDAFNPVTARTYYETLQQIAEMEKAEKDVMVKQTLPTLMQQITQITNGYELMYSFSNVSITTPHKQGSEKKPLTTTMNNLYLGSSLSGILEDSASATVKGGITGMDVPGQDADTETVRPDDAHAEIKLQNVPVKKLSEAVITMIQGGDIQTAFAPVAMPFTIMRLSAILAESDARVEIVPSYIRNQDYTIDIKGEAKTDLTAMYGLTADVTAEFDGLEKLTKSAQNLSDNTGKHDGLVDTLKRIQKLIKPSADSDGKNSGTIMLKVTPQGKILLNGQDAMMVLMETHD